MCGIAGILGLLSGSNRNALKRMTDAIAHRGPDGQGFWESQPDESGWGALLGHRRLSILDLSTAASQPMVDLSSGDALLLNGEIYNYVELRSKLERRGHSFHSTGDTEVMLRALCINGIAAIPELRGMFAFAFWQASSRSLLLARDPLGIKPLYIARNPDPSGDWSLMFASELRGILASGLLGYPRLEPSAVASVAWNGFVVAPDTAVRGVKSVWPGELKVFDAKGRLSKREFYWRFPAPTGGVRLSEGEIEQILESCVNAHLASDVPLGIFLSGGVDSSAVANLAQRTSKTSIHTFTLAFSEAEFNEGSVARKIAEAIGTQHQELVLTEQHFMAHLDTALESLDQPTFDGLNSYYMSHAVRDAGFKVALVGTGGDELFGGYTSFRDLPALARWSKRTGWIPNSMRTGVARLLSAALQPGEGTMPQQTRWAKLADMLACGDDMVSLYQLAYALFLPNFQQQLLVDGVKGALSVGLPGSMRSRLQGEIDCRTPLEAISILEQRLFLGERLLRDTDAASMSASIEVRLPLVDQVLLEQVQRLLTADRYLPIRTKSLLRRIGLRGLDPALFDHPKSGFVLPYDRWLRSGLGKMIDGTMRDPVLVRPTGLEPDAVRRLWEGFLNGSPGLYWSRVWAVYVFIRWCHRHHVYL